MDEKVYAQLQFFLFFFQSFVALQQLISSRLYYVK